MQSIPAEFAYVWGIVFHAPGSECLGGFWLLDRIMRTLFACLALVAALLTLALGGQAFGDERQLLEASGVPAARVSYYLGRVDALAEAFEQSRGGGDREHEADRVAALHAFLHTKVLRGRYLASASDVGVAIDGGPFNCVSATLLWRMVADRCGISAMAMSTRGHVWCRVRLNNAGPKGAGLTHLDIESTSRDWFKIAAKYQGVPSEQVSQAMQAHRRRVAVGRALSERQILAVLHFNRGVTLIRENRLAPAAWANLQAVSLDSSCEPARENLAAVAKELGFPRDSFLSLESRLIWRAIRAEVERESPRYSPLAAR
jgi:hypothetical protein